MSQVDNLTPFTTATLPSLGFDGAQIVVVVVAARYVVPAPGLAQEPKVAQEQRPVPLADVYWGQPGASSLRIEGQGTHVRPGTDIYVSGHAWTPGGRAGEDAVLDMSVGACRRRVRVFGDRNWRAGALGPVPSAPRPFTRLPLVYERCFGGPGSTRNPVGCGKHDKEREALGQRLPNYEDPEDLIESIRDRPLPAGLGPIPRNWRPRRDYGGTYDEAWRRTRAPYWPEDVDPRIMNAAAPGLTASPGLAGGELVRLVGLHPDGPLSFALPRLRLRAKFLGAGPPRRAAMRFDALHLEPDDSSFTLYFRATAPVREDLFEIQRVVIRELHDWEDAS